MRRCEVWSATSVPGTSSRGFWSWSGSERRSSTDARIASTCTTVTPARGARVSGRLDVLSAWREVPDLFSGREVAALALTKGVTRMSDE